MINSATLLDEIVMAAARRGTRHRELAQRVGMYPETWSRIRKRGNVNLETFCHLADAVGLKVALVPADPLAERIVRRELFQRFTPKRRRTKTPGSSGSQ